MSALQWILYAIPEASLNMFLSPFGHDGGEITGWELDCVLVEGVRLEVVVVRMEGVESVDIADFLRDIFVFELPNFCTVGLLTLVEGVSVVRVVLGL